MNDPKEQVLAEKQVDRFRQALGPFVIAVEGTRMPIVFTREDADDHSLVFANDSFLNLMGYERDEVIGQPFDFLMPRVVHPSVLERIRGQFENSTDTVEVECRRKDGSRLWIALSINPVFDEHGEVVQHFISFVDLSAQVRRMRAERDALFRLYEHTPDFIALTEGPDHRFTFANAAYHRLVGPRELLGLPVAMVFPELADQNILEHLDAVYETGEPFEGVGMRVLLQRQAGAELEPVFLNFLCQPVREPDGRITGMFWEGHNVTDQKIGAEEVELLQSKLIHLSRVSAMGTMAATLAHELTQPLAAISNYAAATAYLNSAQTDNRETIAENLAAIGDCVRHGGEIIRRLRETTTRRKSRNEIFDLKEAVHESVVLVRAGTTADVSIEDRSRGMVKLDADRIQIQQVMMNLIRNACEAVAETAGHVRISTVVKRDKVIVSVRDSGKGISPAVAKTLFSWTETTKPKGTGMGLSICRTIVEAHGGELWLEPRGRGGTCFSFSLPVHAGLAPSGVSAAL